MPQTDFDPIPGRSDRLAPGLRRILAPNPSPMTFRGTNTYIVGDGAVAVIDPGPDIPQHLEAILAALAPGESVSHIFVTHAHRDHSGLVPALAEGTGAPVLARGDAFAGRSEVMRRLAEAGLSGGGEGVDTRFRPDRVLADGETVRHGDWSLTALWTPGHAANHLCLAWRDMLFSGDTVMGWASTLVSPPDGDLTDFMASAARLAARPERVFHPGHGAPIPDPADRCRWLIEHRQAREAAILSALSGLAGTPMTVAAITRAVYTDVAPAMLPAAERNVLAHLVDLSGKGRCRAFPTLSADAVFAAV